MEKKDTSKPGEEKKLNYPKEKLLQVMDEVLLDSVDHLLKFSNECKELKLQGPEKVAEQIEDLSEKLHNVLLELEHDICALHEINIEKYYEDVTFYDTTGDKDVKSRLDRLGKLIEVALVGDKIQVQFPIVPELTKEVTLNLYKLILTSHLHLHYDSVQKFLKDNPKASIEELQAAVASSYF